VVEDPHAEPLEPGAHPAHVLRALHAAAQFGAVGEDRERVAAGGGQLVDVGVRLVEDPSHPAPVGQVAVETLPARHGRLASRGLGFDIPDSGAGGGGGAAGAQIALVGQDDIGAGLRGLQRGPGAGRAAARDQDVGGEIHYIDQDGLPFVATKARLCGSRRQIHT